MPPSTASAPALIAHRLPLHARHSSGALRSAPFFEGWTDDELEHFERIVHHVKFQTGDALIREDAPGQAFLIILEGEAEVTQHGRALRRLHPGDHAGEMALLDDSPASATVVARSDIEALVLYPRDFHNLLETIPSLGRRILATLARWFRQTPRRNP
jgi:CRP/FNR family transcriptional regulator, cyclic AMP receptor protein